MAIHFDRDSRFLDKASKLIPEGKTLIGAYLIDSASVRIVYSWPEERPKGKAAEGEEAGSKTVDKWDCMVVSKFDVMSK